jgi:anti-sigma B factor antagonist
MCDQQRIHRLMVTNVRLIGERLIMEFTIQGQDGGVQRVDIAGSITQKKVSKTEQILPDLLGDKVYASKVVFGLEQTEFIDSSGINWLLTSHKRFQSEGGRMVLHSIPELVLKVLRILRLENVFEITANESAAVKAINAPKTAPPSAPRTATADEGDDEAASDEAGGDL